MRRGSTFSDLSGGVLDMFFGFDGESVIPSGRPGAGAGDSDYGSECFWYPRARAVCPRAHV
jgi:hypothetical protein